MHYDMNVSCVNKNNEPINVKFKNIKAEDIVTAAITTFEYLTQTAGLIPQRVNSVKERP